MNAEEANQIAVNAREIKNAFGNIESILEMIAKAASEGNTELNISPSLWNTQVEKLRSLGYTIEQDIRNIDNSVTKISWDKKQGDKFFLPRKYVKEQLAGFFLILEDEADISKVISKGYLEEKFQLLLSGRGINFHEIIRRSLDQYNLKLIKKP